MNNITNKLGGKMIDSGGFGCIFSPALLCNGTKRRKKNTISKLMTTKNAKDEFEKLSSIQNIIRKIPNYTKYFLIDDISICKPIKLTKNDLQNFDKCTALKKDKVENKNVDINERLDDLLAINMPYGGVTVDHFIMNIKSYTKLQMINNKLIDLLINGIIPMNNLNIYHNDIKDSNILVYHVDKEENTIVRMIDWSLTVQYKPFENNVFPKKWRNRPLQFNVPFSIILFTDLFYETYSEFLQNLQNNRNNDDTIESSKMLIKKEYIYGFVKHYLKSWINERGLGHYKYINKIMYMLFINDIELEIKNTTIEEKKKYIQQHYTDQYIIEYLVEILLHFTFFRKDGSLNMRVYLDNVFIHIVDVWGLITAYLPMYELFFENYENLTKNQKLLMENLKIIFLKYLYEPRIKPINIEYLVNNLKNIDTIIDSEIIIHKKEGKQKKTTNFNKLSTFRRKTNKSLKKITMKNKKMYNKNK
jgi:hypothetical protein